MANVIRWYLCPLVARPYNDPASSKIPHSWVNQAGGRKTSVALPGNNYCILRINADSTKQDLLVQGNPPNGFFRLPANKTWADLTNKDKNFITTRWPSVTLNTTDTLGSVAEKLAQQTNPLFNRSVAFFAGVEDGVAEE